MKSLNTLIATLAMGPVIKATPALPPHDVSVQRYRDFHISLVGKYDDPDSYSGQGKTYKVNVKNMGDGYLTYVGLYFPKENEDYRYSSYGFDAGFISNNSVLAPNQEKEMVISANYDAASIDDFYIEGSAYVDFTDEVTITTDNLITVKKTDFTDDHYQYFNSINMTFDKENDQYCYGAIIKVNVKGEDYYFVVNLEDGFSFYSSIALSDKDQAEFEVVKVIKTEYSNYRQSKSNPGPMIVFLVAIPFIVAFMLAGLPIFIVLMVNAARKRKRK